MIRFIEGYPSNHSNRDSVEGLGEIRLRICAGTFLKMGLWGHFIVFLLGVILEAVSEFMSALKPEAETVLTRLEKARVHFERKEFSRKDYLNYFKVLPTATASRDLCYGVENKSLKKLGERALTRYKFKYR